jgi:hypothetical protein
MRGRRRGALRRFMRTLLAAMIGRTFARPGLRDLHMRSLGE